MTEYLTEEQRFSQFYSKLWPLVYVFNIITFFLIYFNANFKTRVISLHFNILLGVDLTGQPYKIYIIPVLSFLFSLINMFIYLTLKRTNRFVFIALPFIAALIIQILAMIAVLFLYKVN